MTGEAVYQPLPMQHGRVRPAPPPLLVQEGVLPLDLVEQARARQAEAEVLVLPREAEAHLQDGDPSLAIYNDSDALAVDVLRRGGVSVDYLAEHRKVVAQFAAAEDDPRDLLAELERVGYLVRDINGNLTLNRTEPPEDE